MKKTYISPVLTVTEIHLQSHLLVDSATGLTVNGNDEVSVNFVKGESSSRSRYNVWDDDWSAE